MVQAVNNNATKVMATDSSGYNSKGIGTWLYARVPNPTEIMTSSVLTASFGVAFEDFVNGLGNNPTAKAFIRDIQKSSGTVYAAYAGTELGSTGVKYDVGHACSAIIKPAFKVAVISGAYMWGASSLGAVSRCANLGGELISRMFANLSIRKQAANATKVSYLEFAKNNADLALVYQAATEGVVKTAAADSMGSTIDFLGITGRLKDGLVFAESKFLSHALGSNIALGARDTLVGKYKMIKAHGDDSRMTSSKIMTFAALTAIDLTLKITTEVIVTCLLAPTVRVAQDGTGVAYRYLADLWKQDKPMAVCNDIVASVVQEEGSLDSQANDIIQSVESQVDDSTINPEIQAPSEESVVIDGGVYERTSEGDNYTPDSPQEIPQHEEF